VAAGDTSTVWVRVEVGDETSVDSTSIEVAILEGEHEELLTAGEDFQIVVDSDVSDGRVFEIEYPHALRLGNYDIEFRARDRNRLAVSFRLPVRYAARLWFDDRPAFAGRRVLPESRGRVLVELPRVVAADALSLRARGPAGDLPAPVVSAVRVDEAGREWDVGFDLPDLETGTYDLVLGAASLEGAILRFQVEDRLRIESVTAYPSPFETDTGFSFVLSQPASVRVRLFTVAGRVLATLQAEGLVDWNYVPWDGRDDDGDPVANGTYLFQITARSAGEVVTSEIGRIVRMK
jgi:hypothetical protein